MSKTKTGAERIAAERQRQIEGEGWSFKHDDRHVNGELAVAGLSYVIHAVDGTFTERPPQMWPWDGKWWKPSNDPVRNLVKAGALIAAEIDRLQRKSKQRKGTK